MRISDWSSDVCSSDLAAAKAAASAAAAAQVAYGGTMDGAEIFNNLCTGCHTPGVGNAPTMDKSHWAARIAQGTEQLTNNAIDGDTGTRAGDRSVGKGGGRTSRARGSPD